VGEPVGDGRAGGAAGGGDRAARQPGHPRPGALLPAVGGRRPGRRHRPGGAAVLAVPGLRRPGGVGLYRAVRVDAGAPVAAVLAPEPAADRDRAAAVPGQHPPQPQRRAVRPGRADPVPVRADRRGAGVGDLPLPPAGPGADRAQPNLPADARCGRGAGPLRAGGGCQPGRRAAPGPAGRPGRRATACAAGAGVGNHDLPSARLHPKRQPRRGGNHRRARV
jgi:hypothetical protein